MKYLKKFENTEQNVNCYYKIIIDGSFDKFVIALEKLGVKDDLFTDWDIISYEDLSEDNTRLFANKSVVLVIYKSEYSVHNPIEYIVRKSLYALPFNIENVVKYNYRGEIIVTDIELDAKKYNL